MTSWDFDTARERMSSSTPTQKVRPGGARRRRANLALAAGALLFALLVAELLLWLLGVGNDPPIVTQESRDFFRRSPTPGLVYEIRPGFAGRAYGCEVKINSHGMRGPERSLKKPPGTRRVLLLGDSVAFGHGVNQSAIFAALLEKTLGGAAAAESGGVEVLNAAVPGYNSAQQRIFLNAKGFSWQPDVVVVVATCNDAEPVYEFHEDGTLGWKDTPPVYQKAYEQYLGHRGLVGFLKRHLRVANLLVSALESPHLLQEEYFEYLEALYAADSPQWLAMQTELREMNAACRARGAAFLLVHYSLPAKPEPAAFRRIRAEFEAFAETQAIAFCDLYDAMTRTRPSQIRISRHDWHPNALGHSRIAKTLAPLIARELSQE